MMSVILLSIGSFTVGANPERMWYTNVFANSTTGQVFAGSTVDTKPSGDDVYLHVFDWPADDRLVVNGLQTPITNATMLGARNPEQPLPVDGNVIDLAGLHPDPHASVIKLELAGAPKITR